VKKYVFVNYYKIESLIADQSFSETAKTRQIGFVLIDSSIIMKGLKGGPSYQIKFAWQ
jgi:hypothetical protein